MLLLLLLLLLLFISPLPRLSNDAGLFQTKLLQTGLVALGARDKCQSIRRSCKSQHGLSRLGEGLWSPCQEAPSQLKTISGQFWGFRKEDNRGKRHQNKAISVLYIQHNICQIQDLLCYSLVSYWTEGST